jgi:N utilization substance protein A
VNGLVKRVEFGNVTIDLGRAEAVLRRDELHAARKLPPAATVCAPTSTTCAKSRVARRSSCRAAIRSSWPSCSARKCRKSTTASSRSSRVARDPGSRAKIAVSQQRQFHRPGRRLRRHARFSRVQAVVQELQGEKIDIIPWSPDPATFIVNALAPAEVSKVVMDEDASHRIEVVVPDDQLSLAIGRRGQNVRLASMLTGWDIDIMTESEESERRQEEFNEPVPRCSWKRWTSMT